MKLSLVISNPAQLLHGYLPGHQFGPQGGSIGSAAPDWRLEDRTNGVRPYHCDIRVIEGRFCVIDRSGTTCVNGHDLPLERHVAISLNDGDRLQIGAYQVVVQLGEYAQGQRSLDELLGGHPKDMHLWQQDLPNTLAADRRPATCPEFERLCHPVDLAEQGDPLRAMRQAPLAEPLPDMYAAATRRSISRFSKLRLGTLLLACLALGGCTMFGKIGQVIWTPSIPVGGPDDQPSRYSLSLYASDNVNPRLISTGTALDEDASLSPYTLNVQAVSPQALTDKVQTLLDHLYESVPARSPLSEEPAPVVPMSPIEDALLGDYDAQGVRLTTPWGKPALAHVATPIAFKVLQLTDDSLLVNASPQALADDLKKTLGSSYIRADDYLLQPGQFKFIDLRALDEDTRFIAVIANYHSTDVGQWKQRLRVEPKGRQYAVLVQLDAEQVSLKGETR